MRTGIKISLGRQLDVGVASVQQNRAAAMDMRSMPRRPTVRDVERRRADLMARQRHRGIGISPGPFARGRSPYERARVEDHRDYDERVGDMYELRPGVAERCSHSWGAFCYSLCDLLCSPFSRGRGAPGFGAFPTVPLRHAQYGRVPTVDDAPPASLHSGHGRASPPSATTLYREEAGELMGPCESDDEDEEILAAEAQPGPPMRAHPEALPIEEGISPLGTRAPTDSAVDEDDDRRGRAPRYRPSGAYSEHGPRRSAPAPSTYATEQELDDPVDDSGIRSDYTDRAGLSEVSEDEGLECSRGDAEIAEDYQDEEEPEDPIERLRVTDDDRAACARLVAQLTQTLAHKQGMRSKAESRMARRTGTAASVATLHFDRLSELIDWLTTHRKSLQDAIGEKDEATGRYPPVYTTPHISHFCSALESVLRDGVLGRFTRRQDSQLPNIDSPVFITTDEYAA